MLNVPLKKQFRGGKDTLVVTGYTKEQRAYLYNNAIYVSGAGEPFKIANLTEEFDIAWVSNEYQIANTVERELRSMVAMYLDNQVPVSTQKEVTPIWVWFDGAEYVLSKTKPTDFMAIQAGYAPAPDNGKPLVLTKFTSAFTLVRDHGKYAVESNYTHAAQYRSSTWVIPDEELREQVEYALNADKRKVEAMEQEHCKHEELLKQHTTAFDAADDRVLGKPIKWGELLCNDGGRRFVKVRSKSGEGAITVMMETASGEEADVPVGSLKDRREKDWIFTPNNPVHPLASELAKMLDAGVLLVSIAMFVDVNGQRVRVTMKRVAENCIGLYRDYANSTCGFGGVGGTSERLVGVLEKNAHHWAYFHLFDTCLVIKRLFTENTDHLVDAAAPNTPMLGLSQLTRVNTPFALTSFSMANGDAVERGVPRLHIHATEKGYVLTYPTNYGELLVGVIDQLPEHLHRKGRPIFVYTPRSGFRFSMSELRTVLRMPIISEYEYGTVPMMGYDVPHQRDNGYGYDDPTLNMTHVGSSRYTESQCEVNGRLYKVRFTGNTPRDLAHCLFISTQDLWLEDEGHWRNFNTSDEDALVFGYLANYVSTIVNIQFANCWSAGVGVDVKHHNNATHITLNKNTGKRQATLSLSVPFGTYIDVSTYINNL